MLPNRNLLVRHTFGCRNLNSNIHSDIHFNRRGFSKLSLSLSFWRTAIVAEFPSGKLLVTYHSIRHSIEAESSLAQDFLEPLQNSKNSIAVYFWLLTFAFLNVSFLLHPLILCLIYRFTSSEYIGVCESQIVIQNLWFTKIWKEWQRSSSSINYGKFIEVHGVLRQEARCSTARAITQCYNQLLQVQQVQIIQSCTADRLFIEVVHRALQIHPITTWHSAQ